MDWVHCNNCYIQPGDIEKKNFFITNCGHIYCEECQQGNKSGECRVCQVQYTVIPLTSNMNSEVEIYFHDPVVNLKKQMKVIEFQQSHRVRLVSHHREIIRGYKAVKKENHNLMEELKACQKENAILREEINRIKNDLYEHKKKYDQSSAKTIRKHSFSQYLTKDVPVVSPHLVDTKAKNHLDDFSLNLKRPINSNFFLMAETKSTKENEINFTTPKLPRFLSNYRSQKTSTPDMNTPPTPETYFKECSQRDALQRRIKLPSGPSPASRIGLHGLSLSRPTLTPKKESLINKFPKYFK